MKHIYRRLQVTLLLVFGLLYYSNAQTKVTGKVVDPDGYPLPGVSILIKGTSNGTTSDLDGNYSLEVKPTDVLVLSFIGFQTTEVEVGSRSVIDVSLPLELMELGEVVVVGYGTLTKREITGSITKLSSKDITSAPVPSFEAALQGKAAGVQVVQGSGMAGSGSLIRIRGISSISAGGDPLYVVDGIPITQDQFTSASRNGGAMNTNPLATLNPNDIQSIEILKDAAAAGIYGSRGANGVILITTKRGTGSGDKFNFSTRLGVSTPTAKAKMLNTEEYLQLYQEAWENDGNVGRATLPGGMTWEEIERRNIDTDWWDETVGTGFKQEYNFSWNHGGKKFKTYTGLSYSDNESFLIGNSYERLSGRVNFNYDPIKDLKVSGGISYARGSNDRVNAAWSGGIGQAMSTALPIYPIFNEDGTYFFTNDFSNPVRQSANTDWNTIDTRVIGNLSLNYSPIENLNLNLSGSYDFFEVNDDKWESGELVNRPEFVGQAFANITEVDNYNIVGTAEYLMKIRDNDFKVMVGSEYQQSVRSGVTGKGVFDVTEQLRFDPEVEFDSLRQAGELITNEETKFFSAFARFNYNVALKYFFQATLRTDGSSKFGPNNRFGFFPTVGFSWFANEEGFLSGATNLSVLKFKINYGITGNSNLPVNQFLGIWDQLGPIAGEGNGYAFNDIRFPTQFPNPDLKWETTNNFDVGVEIGFFNDRIVAEADYFHKLTNDVLMDLALPGQIGLDSRYFANVGQIVNQGWELAVNSTNVEGDFTWQTNFNISQYRNKIKSIGNFSEESVSGGTNDTRVIVGQPVGTNYLVRYAGVDTETGLPIYLDINGNETSEWTPQDRVAVGDVLPDFVGGLTNTFSYKNWSLSALFSFTIGGNIYDSSSKRQLGVVTDWNMRRDIFDRWRQPGDQTTYPRLTLDTETYGSNTHWINTDLWLHDGTYARLRNLQLSYNVPVNKFIHNLNITLSGTNLLTFTKFEGLDPEIARDFENATDRNMSGNITYLTPPQEKSYNLSVSFEF